MISDVVVVDEVGVLLGRWVDYPGGGGYTPWMYRENWIQH